MERRKSITSHELRKQIEAMKREVARKERKLKRLEQVTKAKQNIKPEIGHTKINEEISSKIDISNKRCENRRKYCKENMKENTSTTCENDKTKHVTIRENTYINLKNSTTLKEVSSLEDINSDALHTKDHTNKTDESSLIEIKNKIIHPVYKLRKPKSTEKSYTEADVVNCTSNSDSLVKDDNLALTHSKKLLNSEQNDSIVIKIKSRHLKNEKIKVDLTSDIPTSDINCLNIGDVQMTKCPRDTPTIVSVRRSRRLSLKQEKYSDTSYGTNTDSDSSDHKLEQNDGKDLENRQNSCTTDNFKNIFLKLTNEAKQTQNQEFFLPDGEYLTLKNKVTNLSWTGGYSENIKDISVESISENIKEINLNKKPKLENSQVSDDSIIANENVVVSKDISAGQHSNLMNKCESEILDVQKTTAYVCEKDDKDNYIEEDSLKADYGLTQKNCKLTSNVIDHEKQVKLFCCLKTDSKESIERLCHFVIPICDIQEFLIVQQLQRVLIWMKEDSSWILNYTYTVDKDVEILDSHLFHGQTTIYFVVLEAKNQNFILHVFTYNCKLKELKRFHSQSNPAKMHYKNFVITLCKLKQLSWAVSYSVDNESSIYIFNIKEYKDKPSVCSSYLLTSLEDNITSLLTVEKLASALLGCGEYIYIWNYTNNKLIKKIHLGKELSIRNCYWAHADLGLLVLVMTLSTKANQQTDACLLVANPVNSMCNILRTYNSIHRKAAKIINIQNYKVNFFNDGKLSVYNLFTAQETITANVGAVTALSTIGGRYVILGFDNGCTHFYSISNFIN